MTRILVIKLGALGDIVQALGAIKAIRRYHRGARIDLVTQRPFVDFLTASGLVDQVDAVPQPTAFPPWPWDQVPLARALARKGYTRVYDLQTSRKSSRIFVSWPKPKPEWSGIAQGCSHPHANPQRDFMHTLDRQAEQLAMAGIKDVPPPDLEFAITDPGRFGLTQAFALIAPGGAEHRPEKRWPIEDYGIVARHLADQGLVPVIIGQGAAEAAMAARIQSLAPSAQSLVNKTSLLELAGLARHAALALGNDSGPMHLATVAGAPSLVLFGPASDPALCAPRGPHARFLRAPNLADLPPVEVIAALTRHP